MRIAELVHRLHETERELQALTGGQLEAIRQEEFDPLLMRGSQELGRATVGMLRHAAEMQVAILNALPAHIALLDPQGVILSVNESWRSFASANMRQNVDFFVGQNYLAVCEKSSGDCADEAREAADGIRSVLSGEKTLFSLEYPCHSATEQRWYRLMVTPLSHGAVAGAVVMHVNVTERRLAEENLRSNKQRSELEVQRLHESQAVAHVGSWETDLTTMLVTWTAETHRIFGTHSAEYCPTHEGFLSFVHPDDRDRVDAAFAESSGRSGVFSIDHRICLKDGTIKQVEERWQVINDDAGRPMRAVGTCHDITARIREQETRGEAEERNRAIVASALDAIITIDHESRILEFNPSAEAIFGWSKAEVLGRDLCEVIIPERLRDAHRRGVARFLETGEKRALDHRLELPAIRADGSEIVIELNATRLGKSTPPQFTAFIRDLTQQKQAEQALAETRERYQTLVETSHDLIYSVSPEGEILFINEASRGLLGYAPDELIGRQWVDLIPADRKAQNLAVFAELLQSGEENADHIAHVLHKNGSTVVIRANSRPLLDKAGKLIGRIGTARDVTESIQAEAALRASESRFRALFEQAAVGMCLVSEDGQFLRTNHRFCEIVGYSAEEMLQRDCVETTHPDDRAMEAETVSRMLAGEFQTRFWEKRYLHKNGTTVWCHLTLALMAGEKDGERQFMAVIEDITGRKLAEDESRRSAGLLQAVADSTSDAVFVKDLQGRYLLMNEAAARFVGKPFAEVIGRDDTEIFELEGARVLMESDREVMRSGQIKMSEEHLTAAGVARIYHTTKAPYRDDEGRIIGLVGISRDISEQKRLQLETARLAQRLTNTLESITDAFFTLDRDWRFTYVNPQAERLLERPKDELLGENLWELFPAAVGNKFQHEYERAVNERTTVSFDDYYHDLEMWLEVRAYPSEEGLAVYFKDITRQRENDAQLRLLETSVSRLNDIVVITDAEPIDAPGPRIVYVNDAFVHRTGYTREEVLGKSPRFLQGPKTQRDALDRIRTALTEWKPVREELINYTKSGEELWLELDIVPVADATGWFTHWVAIERDVTKRRQAEETLKQKQTLLRIAGRAAKLGGWNVSLPDYKITWTDETALIHGMEPGYSPNLEEAIGFYSPECRDAVAECVRVLATDGTPFDIETELITARQRRIWVRAIGEAQRDSAGQIVSLCGAFQDITERKIADLELIASNRALQLLSRFNEMLSRAESEAQLLQEICDIAVDVGGFSMAWVGYAQDDADQSVKPQASSGKGQEYLSGLQISWAEDHPMGQGPTGRVIRSGEPLIIPDISSEVHFAPWMEKARENGIAGVSVLPIRNQTRTFGVLVLCSAEVRPVPRANEISLLRELADDLAFGIGSMRSQSDRRRMELAIRKMAVSVSAGENRDFFCQLAGNMAEALGAEVAFVARLLPGEPRKAVTIAAIVDGKQVENFEYEVTGTPCEQLLENDDCIVHARLTDLFPKSPTLKELGAKAYCGRRLTNANNETIGFLFALSRRTLERSEFITSTLQIFATRATAELERRKSDARLREQASLLDKARDAILVRDLDHTIRFWNQSAERLYGWTAEEAIGRSSLELIYRNPLDFLTALDATLANGEWQGELQQFTKSGMPLVVEARWTLVNDGQGQPSSILAISTDITERKNLEQQFLRAQRMESIGTLAGGIAHDLNNVLAPIMMAIELLKMQEQNVQRLNILNTIEISSRRGADMVKQVLSFARGVEGQRLDVQPTHLLKDIEKLANETFLKNIEVTSDVAADLWAVRGDPTQLHQVLLNLCVNARDAMPQGGKLSLAASNLMLDEHYAGMNIEAAPGPYVRIVVEDSGTGMPPGVVDRIFDPFFTTKEQGKGTGLGLSTSLAIIKSHGGFIRAYSEIGVGTRFHVYLPAQTESSIASIEPPKVQIPCGHGQLILVVDDEAAIRQITQQTLEAFGYRVVLASDGAEAIAIYGVQQEEIAAVITDMMMPVMDGPATIRVLMRMNPDVRIIAASGLNANGMIAKAANAGIKHFIPKPYTAETLLKMLHMLLHEV